MRRTTVTLLCLLVMTTFGMGPQPPLPVLALPAHPVCCTQVRYAQDVNGAVSFPYAVPWEDMYAITHAPDGIGTTCSSVYEPWISEWVCPYDFGFDIPTGATILGVSAEVRARWSQEGPCYLSTIVLTQGWDIGTMIPLSPQQALGANLTSAWANYGHGGYGDLWDTGITPADVNATMFGCAIYGRQGDNRMTMEIDSVKMTVWYTCN